jgi:hypothetical protein
MGRTGIIDDDPRNIKGLGILLNEELMSNDTDPTLIEQSIINNVDDLDTVEEIDPIALYEKDCKKIIDDESGEEDNEDEESSSEDEEETEVPTQLSDPKRDRSMFQQITEEQTEQGYINKLITNRWGEGETSNNPALPLRLDEYKLGLLEEIDDIIQDLKGEVDLSTLPTVTYSSPLEDVERVHIILRKKHERISRSNLANDWVMMFSEFAEMVFNGEREVFGFKPNLTGVSKKLKVKLRRIRHDTSIVVNQILNDNGIGPMTRIVLEILPTILIHGRVNENEKKNLGERLSSATTALREFDPDPRHRDDVFY